MSKVSDGFKVRLEYVLDQVCVGTPGGGTHEMRSYVAAKLIQAAEAGERSLDGLIATARNALDALDQAVSKTACIRC